MVIFSTDATAIQQYDCVSFYCVPWIAVVIHAYNVTTGQHTLDQGIAAHLHVGRV